MNNLLFHKDIGFPKTAIDSVSERVHRLLYTDHALHQAKSDRYGDFSNCLPDMVFVSRESVVEIETDPTLFPLKVVARVRVDNRHDLVIAFKPFDGIVKTVWVNEASDHHKTLQRRKYAVPN